MKNESKKEEQHYFPDTDTDTLHLDPSTMNPRRAKRIHLLFFHMHPNAGNWNYGALAL